MSFKAPNQDFKDMDVFCSTEDYANSTEPKPELYWTRTKSKPKTKKIQLTQTELSQTNLIKSIAWASLSWS